MTTTHDKISKALEETDLRDFPAIGFYTLYLQMTPKEREEMTAAMRKRIESRQQDSVEYFKRVPLALEGLPVSSLMDVVEVALSDAYDWIVKKSPEVREKLSAYETLSIFYMTHGEKSERDMREVIGAICTAWDVTFFPVSTETKPTTKAKSRPRRPG